MKKSLTYLIPLGIALVMLIGLACEETSTEPGNYAVNLNLTLSSDEVDSASVEGLIASFYIYDDETAEEVLYTDSTTIEALAASFSIPNVVDGDYLMLLVVDIDGVAEADGNPMDRGDMIWGAMDVDVSADLTINLDEEYLQRFHTTIIGVRGIPSGHTGELISAGLLAEGTDFYDLQSGLVLGGAVPMYNQTALVFPSPVDIADDTEWSNYELTDDDYTLFVLLDHDGELVDYQSDGPLQPLSDGDYYYERDYTYQEDLAEGNFAFFTATFEPIAFSGITLSVDYTLSTENLAFANGEEVVLSLWNSLDDDYPVRSSHETVSSATGTVELENVADTSYQITLTIGNTDGEHDFLYWSGLNVDISDDLTVDVEENWWQTMEYCAIGVTGIPSALEGELVIMALFPDNGDYYNFLDTDNFIMSGIGFVYNGATLVALSPTDDSVDPFVLPNGNYDVVALIDTNGTWAYYEAIDFSTLQNFCPYEADDQYSIINYTFDSTDNDNQVQIFNGTFSAMPSINGDVACSNWNSSGGNIYVMSFNSNPFEGTQDTDIKTFTTITQPASYALPVFPNFDGYVLAFWDADDSGLGEGQPSNGDYVGFHGASTDSLYSIQVLTSDVEDIDLDLDMQYSN